MTTRRPQRPTGACPPPSPRRRRAGREAPPPPASSPLPRAAPPPPSPPRNRARRPPPARAPPRRPPAGCTTTVTDRRRMAAATCGMARGARGFSSGVVAESTSLDLWKVTETACDALNNVAYRNADNQAALLDLGVLPACLTLLNRHSSAPTSEAAASLHAGALNLLINMADTNRDSQDASRVARRRCGCPSAARSARLAKARLLGVPAALPRHLEPPRQPAPLRHCPRHPHAPPPALARWTRRRHWRLPPPTAPPRARPAPLRLCWRRRHRSRPSRRCMRRSSRCTR